MPAFGKNGIVNLNQSKSVESWEVHDSSGQSFGTFRSEQQANAQKEILSKSVGGQLTVTKKELHCL